MRTVAAFMARAVITASPEETVAAVARRLAEHRIGGAPVVDPEGRIVGIVTLRDLVGQPPYRPVREVMTRQVITVSPGERITDAYDLMKRHGVGRLPVVDEAGRVVGVVTRGDLLHELGRLTDPLTGLPWSGTLRQQAADLLKAGREITVLFIDLDDFGLVNKLYGHVVGDRVIQAVAALVRDHTDPARDSVCRYAGDEFAIVSTRSAAEATALARRLREAIVELDVPGAPPGSISASVGIAGGKRTAERHDIHYEATVDDLLTLASRASTLAKRTEERILHGAQIPPAAPHPGPGPTRRAAIRRIDLGVEEGRGTATVELEWDGHRATGQAAGPALGTAGLRLLVDATVTAARQWLPPQWEVAVEEISRTPLDQGEAVHILLVAARPGGGPHYLLGSALFTADPHEAVVRATMKAVNRILAQARRIEG
ncbi:MAG: CBS domain-containing protein [Armatimonadota bacterium]|nr:CBS domain-containing protein [Armatimonadota bacterium]MDR7436486.1 CBS domain-containing protein [Armatimonadota bacterium]MDR7472521.1 CBS domain-containing protein [Armatimonadota bacterium]MDR7506023.1 CBS domain-containing protein [Armatimonadota bacterium]MDR7517335.1 CBS domain-containing protein [Armatimonadota bacterium]